MTLKELTDLIIKQAKVKGFGTRPGEVNTAEKFALIHSEVSEAYEAYRKNQHTGKDGFASELGDIVQRVLHLAAIYGVDIEEAILKKLELNKTREWDFKELNETGFTKETRGKFIVVYGTNNIGKTTQIKLLKDRIKKSGKLVTHIKYPVYDIEPTGPRINSILREGAEPNLTTLEVQKIFAQNRRDFEPKLKEILDSGINVLAEDYKGTGIAWGYTRGTDLNILEEINKDLLEEDVVILLDGMRFISGMEKNHMNEQDDDLLRLSRRKHQEIGRRYGWNMVYANQTPEEVHQDVWEIVEPHL